jgi:hypothetical protein
MKDEPSFIIPGFKVNIAQLALLLMVATILLPAFTFSTHLSNPTPAQLLVAICIGIFSSVICLWILDAVSVIQFRSEWVSKSIWGAAIISILGTGVGVFQGGFSERKYQFEGAWEFRALPKDSTSLVAENTVVLTHSEAANIYWGYSNVIFPADPTSQAISVEIVDFRPEADGAITARLIFKDAKPLLFKEHLKKDSEGKHFVSDAADIKYYVTLERSR